MSWFTRDPQTLRRWFYASGPGDTVRTYLHWKQGEDDPSEPVVAYSGQFYELCREYSARGYVVSTCSRPDELQDGAMHIVHRPNPWQYRRGWRFHLGQMLYGLRMVGSVLRFRADVAIVNEGTHWFVLALLPLAGVRVVPSLHVRMVPPGRRLSLVQRMVQKLNRAFFRHGAAAILTASAEIEGDLGLANSGGPPVYRFLPVYRRATFADVASARHEQRPFHVLYVGRVEANKGVFDFLAAARQVCAQRDDVRFHVCGRGTALDELRSRVMQAGLAERFELHGYCDRDRLMRAYGQAHVVVVPTRAEIAEGFNQVTAEAVLAGRPVITSSMCPAAAAVGEAAVLVAADDVEGYARAILQLASDGAFYRQKQRACRAAQEQFYDATHGWQAALREALAHVQPERRAVKANRPRNSECSEAGQAVEI